MRSSAFPILITSAVFLVLGCASDKSDTADTEAWLEQGAAAIRPFKVELKAALAEGMAEGPEAALAVCRVKAPHIAEVVGSETLTVGRTSHKLRNPANAPRAWMKPLLEEAASKEKAEPRVVDLGSGRLGYVEPIYVGAPCLTCHGEVVGPAVESKIAELYPEDKARGFAEGDFRGLFWAEFTPTPGKD